MSPPIRFTPASLLDINSEPEQNPANIIKPYEARIGESLGNRMTNSSHRSFSGFADRFSPLLRASPICLWITLCASSGFAAELGETYVDSRGFCMRIPSGWAVKDREGNLPKIVKGPVASGFGANIVVAIVKKERGSLPDNASRLIAAAIKNAKTEVRQVSQTAFTGSAAGEAYKFLLERQKPMPISQFIYIFERHKELYEVVCSVSRGAAHQWEPAFDECVRSMQFGTQKPQAVAPATPQNPTKDQIRRLALLAPDQASREDVIAILGMAGREVKRAKPDEKVGDTMLGYPVTGFGPNNELVVTERNGHYTGYLCVGDFDTLPAATWKDIQPLLNKPANIETLFPTMGPPSGYNPKDEVYFYSVAPPPELQTLGASYFNVEWHLSGPSQQLRFVALDAHFSGKQMTADWQATTGTSVLEGKDPRGAPRSLESVQAQLVSEYQSFVGQKIAAATQPKDKSAESRLREVLDKLLTTLPPAFPRVRLVLTIDKTPNAMIGPDPSTNGSVLLATTSLLEVLAQDQLATVLGHELGHALRDTAYLGNLKYIKETCPAWVLPVVDANYRRAEHHADLMGVELAREAGFDPASLSRALERLAQNDPVSRSHPATKNRILLLNWYCAYRGFSPGNAAASQAGGL